MTPETFRLATAATHLVPALLWGTIAYDLWHYLRHRRPEGIFPRLVLALACTTTLHYATWSVTALIRGHLQGPSVLRGVLMAVTDGSVILLIALARHVGVSWGRRGEPTRAWLAVNYGLCAVMLTAAVTTSLLLFDLAGWQTYAAYSVYMLALGIAVVIDFRRGAARGSWRAGGLWQARTADVVVLGAALVMVGIQQIIPAMLGTTSLELLLRPEPSWAALAMMSMNGIGALLFATPLVVRNLGDLLPGFLTAMATMVATGR